VTAFAAETAVTELLTALTWLTANLQPGTHRIYIPPQLSAEKRAEIGAQIWLERHTGVASTMPLGESPAPLDLDIADLIAEISDAADDMCRLVSLAARTTPPRQATWAFEDPRPYLHRVLDLLPKARTVHATVEARCDNLIFRAHTLLGLFGDGQLLKATCPWCGGRTSKHPAGGAETLRVRAMTPKDSAGKPLPITKCGPDDVDWFVVCESGLCEPPEADYGTRLRGRPAWNLRNEGGFLADRIERSQPELVAS